MVGDEYYEDDDYEEMDDDEEIGKRVQEISKLTGANAKKR